ncbi:hypothetical protein V501_05268 [Pseudogymnoascus sp. VKM F-4519 (FW-2642)]|nr:hypothetical protein V501_05268 [Pseudogymnoascus sp. VKM F-4519 (FW-2642)]
MSSPRRYPPPPPPPSTPPLRPFGPPPPPPPALIELLRKEREAIENAITDDDNILVRIAYPAQKLAFWTFLHSQKSEIERVVAHHLQLDVTACQMEYVDTWIPGSFNVCIPVCIVKLSGTSVVVGIPLPYKIGEATNPGNVDEKLRCEAASIHQGVRGRRGYSFRQGSTTIPINADEKVLGTGSYWYFQGVNSPKGMIMIFNKHIQSMFCAENCKTTVFDDVVSSYWARDVDAVIEKKLKEEDGYKEQIRNALLADPSRTDSTR